ncbi:MAG: PspC domain-containing protein [Candidatus Spechtbacterales bacterium]|nr:PspC domain-containing protein [Candidatus Spechtbacterales bacterium]
MKKKLYRSTKDRMLGGVIAGLAEYLEADTTLLRLAAALFVIFTGLFPGVVVYVAAWAIIPEKPGAKKEGKKIADK